jgi:hypothetical protein
MSARHCHCRLVLANGIGARIPTSIAFEPPGLCGCVVYGAKERQVVRHHVPDHDVGRTTMRSTSRFQADPSRLDVTPMALSTSQMASMDQLLDEALPPDREGRRRWLQALAPENQDPVVALRRALTRINKFRQRNLRQVVNQNYGLTLAPTECFACHLTDYKNANNPNHVAAGFSTSSCAVCHNTVHW